MTETMAQAKKRMREMFIELCKETADAAMEDAINMMQERGQVGGILFGFDVRHNLMVEQTFGWSNAKERQRTLFMLKILLAAKQCAFYIIVNEGWCKSYMGEEAKKEAAKPHEFGKLSRDPDRIEVISVISVCPIHRELRSTKILREVPNDESSKIIGFEPMENANDHLDGDFYTLLNPKLTEIYEEKLK